MIGGEGAIDQGWMSYGQWYENAKTHHALMFQPEHRYYGKTHPTPDASTANLKWLSSEQALADLVSFINGMKAKYNIPNAKVITFGGSYPGNLAAWFREKYPEMTVGSVASSAPVLAEADFVEYMETVGQAAEYFSPGCYDNIQKAVQQIDSIISAGGSLNGKITLCDNADLRDADMRAGFYSELINPWMGVTQYNGQQGSFAPTVKSLCSTMADQSYDLATRMYRVFEQVYGSYCIEPDQSGSITELQGDQWTDVATEEGERQWLYQTCTEFGYYQTTDSDGQPFGNAVTISFLEKLYCKAVFNIDVPSGVDAAVAKTNDNYGGKDVNKPKQPTNLLFINGSIDPWHPLSVLTNLSSTVLSCYITGTSHCQDMQGSSFGDSAELKACRKLESDSITQWLSA
jgi:hypothetical protein